MSHFGDFEPHFQVFVGDYIANIRQYIQYLGDVQLRHLPIPVFLFSFFFFFREPCDDFVVYGDMV